MKTDRNIKTSKEIAREGGRGERENNKERQLQRKILRYNEEEDTTGNEQDIV